ncbi:MAG: response regulator transcription factor [Myxococcota bacterium]
MRVLLAEDDVLIREGLREILEGEGYEVLEAGSGTKALELFDAYVPDFVLLDIMMPGKSGYEVCKALRARDERLPIIFISAKSEEIDRVLGLELGADDFIVKPFGVREVVARIRSVSRRCLASRDRANDSKGEVDESAAFELADLRVMPRELRAQRGEARIDLSLRDVAILRLLAQHPGEVLTRERLAEVAWGANHYPSSRAIDQHISQLRKRVERDPKKPAIIRTVHGAGYRYEP